MSDSKLGYLARYGESLINKGYRITPVREGTKAAFIDRWQRSYATLEDWRGGVANGLGRCNVGVICGEVRAIDIDIYDEGLAKEIDTYALSEVGIVPTRVGRAPKRLLPFLSDHVRPSKRSKTFLAPGEPDSAKGHRIEFLGEWTQFVAFGRHPDTNADYQRPPGCDLASFGPASSLPVLTEETEEKIINYYEQRALELGFQVKGSRIESQPNSGGDYARKLDPDDPFHDVVQKVRKTNDENLV